MKKLMITACAVAFATLTQAATVNWSANETLISGDAELWSGTYPTANQFDIYVYSSADLGSSTYADVLSAIQKGTGADWLKVGTDKALGKATLDAGTGGFSIAGTTATETDANTVNLFAIIVDKTDKQYAFVVDAADFTVGKAGAAANLNNTGLGEDYDGYIFAADYTNAGQVGSNWYSQAVPEPTSGLLLLLGVAGLALRRRRA